MSPHCQLTKGQFTLGAAEGRSLAHDQGRLGARATLAPEALLGYAFQEATTMMKLLLSALVFTAPVHAAIAAGKGGKLARPGEARDARVSEPKATEGEATAIRKIGIAIFPDSAGAVTDSAVAFCEHLAKDLKAKSYLVSTCLKQTASTADSPKSLAELGRKSAVDAILTGSMGKGSIEMTLISARSGRAIGTIKSNSTKADPAVEAIVAAIPYRGYVVEVNDDDEIEINLGSTHGLQPGMVLQLFELTGPTLSASRTNVAVAEVTEVDGPSSSSAKIIEKRGTVREFTKIAHEDAEAQKDGSLASASGNATAFSFGVEVLTINTELNGLLNVNRTYSMNSTPFVQVGVARERWFAQFWYGYASDVEETLSYSSFLAAYNLKTINAFKTGYSISLGAWVSQYSASARRSSTRRVLEDSTRYSPHIEVRYQYVPARSLALFASGEVNYPVFASGQDSGQVPFSYSFGTTPGLRYNITDWMSLEAGGRFQYLAIPLAGKKGTFESHLGYFVRGVFLL